MSHIVQAAGSELIGNHSHTVDKDHPPSSQGNGESPVEEVSSAETAVESKHRGRP